MIETTPFRAVDYVSWRTVPHLFRLGAWRLALSAIVALALAGCATKPLMVSCLTREQLAELKAQEPPKIHDKLTGKADEDVRIIAGSNLRLRSWGGTLMGVLEVCAK